jgi:hypothetical protein
MELYSSIGFPASLLPFVSGSSSILTNKALNLNNIHFEVAYIHAILFPLKKLFGHWTPHFEHITVSNFTLICSFSSESEQNTLKLGVFYMVLGIRR